MRKSQKTEHRCDWGFRKLLNRKKEVIIWMKIYQRLSQHGQPQLEGCNKIFQYLKQAFRITCTCFFPVGVSLLFDSEYSILKDHKNIYKVFDLLRTLSQGWAAGSTDLKAERGPTKTRKWAHRTIGEGWKRTVSNFCLSAPSPQVLLFIYKNIPK